MRSLAILAFGFFSCKAFGQRYEVFNISESVSPRLGLTALNDRGDIGGRDFVARPSRAASYINGQYRTYDSPSVDTYALDINNSGTLLGYYGNSDPTGVFWDVNGVMHRIPLVPGGTNSIGLTIGDDGSIAGVAEGPNGPQMAIWRNGEIETFGWIPTRWNAGVRDYGGGKFIGDLYGTVEGDLQGSFIFDTVTRRLTTYSTQSDDGPFTMLWDINNLGQAVGEQSLGLGNGYGGVLIDDSGATSFGTGFKPETISDAGVMLGMDEEYQEKLIYRDGEIEAVAGLVPAGWDIRSTGEINARGQILAGGYYNGSSVPQRLLLTPVPEPGTWAAFLVGGALLWRKRFGKSGSR